MRTVSRGTDRRDALHPAFAKRFAVSRPSLGGETNHTSKRLFGPDHRDGPAVHGITRAGSCPGRDRD